MEDSAVENTEDFTISISSDDSAVQFGISVATIFISDDEDSRSSLLTCMHVIYGVCFYPILTAVTVGFTESTNSVTESDVTTTLECVVTVAGQLERDLAININTDDDTATGQWFLSGWH